MRRDVKSQIQRLEGLKRKIDKMLKHLKAEEALGADLEEEVTSIFGVNLGSHSSRDSALESDSLPVFNLTAEPVLRSCAQQIVELLRSEERPLTAGEMFREISFSRQAIGYNLNKLTLSQILRKQSAADPGSTWEYVLV